MDAAVIQARVTDLRVSAAGGIRSGKDYGFAWAEIGSAETARAVSQHCTAEEVHSDTEAGRFGTEDRTRDRFDQVAAGIAEVVQKVEDWGTAAAYLEARKAMVVGEIVAVSAVVGKADLVGHTAVGRRCSWQVELRTALAVGHIPVNRLAAAIIV